MKFSIKQARVDFIITLAKQLNVVRENLQEQLIKKDDNYIDVIHGIMNDYRFTECCERHTKM